VKAVFEVDPAAQRSSARHRTALRWVGRVVLVVIVLESVGLATAFVQGLGHATHPFVLARLPVASALFSRVARGTWDVNGPADRIDLPNRRRYYISRIPPTKSAPDLSGYIDRGLAIWPDRAWYVEKGAQPVIVWAQTRDGSFYEYSLSGGW
jgi:hypothetical protein